MKTRTAVRISLILLATMVVLAAAASGADYNVVKTWKLGGDGGWDYLTMDSAGHRLFIARATRVMVIDTESGKQVGEIPETAGVHGVALVPEIGRGFTSNGREDTVSVFDLKSLAVEKKIKVGSGPDAILYDPFSKRVFTFNGKGHDTTALDASKGEVVGKIELGGKPEFAATDENGTAFDADRDLAFASAGDGTITVIKEDGAAKFSVVQTVSTQKGARTMAVDTKTHQLFTVTANVTGTRQDRKIEPNSFVVLVVEAAH